MDNQPGSDPVTLLSALSNLMVTSQRRRLLRHGDLEYTVALSEEVRLSKIVFLLAQELRVQAQS